MATAFTELFVEKDVSVIEGEILEGIEAAFEDWHPAAGDLEFWLIKGFARIASAVFDVASIVTRAAFKTFGQTIVSVPPILAAPATVESTWEAIDEAGHKIPAGTEVTIVEGDESYGFRTVADVEIPAGKSKTDPGEVLLEAVLPGTSHNGLSAAPALKTSLAAIKLDGIVLTGISAGGVDEESEDDYLNRLVEELQTLTMSAVVIRDYEILARRVPEVAYATALDNYDPDLDEFGKPLVVSVAVADVAKNDLTEGSKAKVKAELEARSLSNIVTHVIDYTSTSVGAKVKITVRPGYEEAATVAAAEARLLDYLSPAPDPENELFVYINEIIPVVDQVAGVGRVLSVELSKNGGAFGKADIELDGPAALVKAGTVEVTAE